MDWLAIKLVIVEVSSLSKDALHVLGGASAHVLFAFLFRRSLAHPLPWLLVLAGELMNEWYDLNRETWLDRPMWPGSVKDVLVTMAIPSAALILVRLAPALFRHAQAADLDEKRAEAD